MKPHPFWCLALAASMGCAGARPRTDPKADAAAIRGAAAYKAGGYRIAPSDLLSAAVYPDPQLGAKTRVDADGGYSLPLVGRTAIAGLTVREAEKLLEKKLSDYLVQPHVTLLIEEFGNKEVFVLGAVQKPGPVLIPGGGRITALQAVGGAGGFSDIAAKGKTVLVRYTADGGVQRVVDLEAVADGAADSDVVLEPNDVLYVPQTYF